MSVKTSFSNLCVALKKMLGNKVDKVSGKGLSTNDFTTAYKTKLDGIAIGATKITIDTTLSASSTNPVQNKAVNTAITNIKNDLINYYKKTETYSKTEIDTKISSIPKFSIKVVKTLPTTDISATTVYLKTSETSLAGNLYDEYIYVDSKWELLGSQTVNLSGYVTTSSMNTALANKVDKVEGKGLSTNDYTTTEKNKLAGIATGANKTVVDSDISTTSTNPVQSKAVGLKFQGVDSEISGINSSLTAKTAEITTIVNEYGSKNLLSLTKINKGNATGIDVSFISNGGIWVHGTKTTNRYGDIYCSSNVKTTLKPNTKYTLTSVNSAPNAMTVRMHLVADNKTIYIGNNASNVNKTSITFTTPNASNVYVDSYAITVTNNNPIDVSVYPMLRYAAIKDDTYVPYAMTNRELTEKVIDTGWKTTGNLKYRKSGYIIALQGSVTSSDSTMSITLGTLPNDCRPSQDINIAQAGTDTPSRQIIVQTNGNVVLLFASNCTASHTYAYNGIFMI